ncbi:MAG: SAM-dependent methyltransferase [Actinomycetota bacterium]
MNPANDQTARFYDRWTELFQRGFGPVFQAGILRTGDPPREDPERSVIALAERAGIANGDRILDAGCGIGGPAAIIARRFPDARIDGATNSVTQARIARSELVAADLSDRVVIHVADYQSLPFSDEVFDVVVLFESTGYASDVDQLYRESARVLVPGGRLYVKDVFCRTGGLSVEESAQIEAFDRLWGCIRTKTVEESVAAMMAAGFDVKRAGAMDEVGTARLVGSMFTLQPSGSLARTELGAIFAPGDLDPPIEFAEIYATKPG